MRIFILMLLLTHIAFSSVIEVEKERNVIQILNQSEVYLDKTKKLNLLNVKNRDFSVNSKDVLSYGYSPNFNVWVRFTLRNSSDETIHKVLEYNNPLTTDITFYSIEENVACQEGAFHIDKKRSTVNPHFSIGLRAGESKTFYLKASSYVTPVIVELKLWKPEAYNTKENKHQIILAFFFGAMIILAVYNLFLYFFTRDKSYLYYVVYMFGIALHQSVYVGMLNIFEFTQSWNIYLIEYASLLVAIPALSLALFTKEFIQTYQYKRLNFTLNIAIVIVVLTSILSIFSDVLNHLGSLFPFILLLILMIVSIYSAYKKMCKLTSSSLLGSSF